MKIQQQQQQHENENNNNNNKKKLFKLNNFLQLNKVIKFK